MLKKYLITSDISSLESKIEKHNPDYLLYRDKTTSKYEKRAEEFINLCSKHSDKKAFIHRNVELALKLKAHGVHLTSLGFGDIKRAKELGLKVILSTHTHEEALKAQELGADFITYSPIFASPNKGKPKGIDDLNTLLKKCVIRVFALGGIVEEKEICEIEKTDSYGFASIRYFD